MNTLWQLAQCNVARTRWERDHPGLAGFFAQVPTINALADSSPGFVWRWDGAPDDPRLLVNISVWESIDALKAFAYQSAHVGVFRDRAKWFKQPEQAHQVLWWVQAGHQPTLDEAMAPWNNCAATDQAKPPLLSLRPSPPHARTRRLPLQELLRSPQQLPRNASAP